MGSKLSGSGLKKNMVRKKLKVCHIANIDITVGFLLMSQLKFLINQGYSVYAVCAKGKMVKDIESQGIRVKTIEIKRKLFSPISDTIAFLKLYFYFKKEKFDIVHTHAPKPGLLGQLAAKLAGVPVIINTIHGLYFTEKSSWLKRKFYILAEKIAALCSTLIFSQNKEDISTMIKEKIAPAEKIKYLGNGIDINKFNIGKYDGAFILKKKKELGLDVNVKIIGTVGRLVQEKGYFELFEAMKEVLKKYPNSLLLVVGPNEPSKKDAFDPSVVKNYGIEKNVVFLGERKDVDEIYPIMDIFILASHREGFPRSVIEAMAMQRPIIVTNIRGCREEIDNGINGIMIPVKSPDSITKEIIFLLDNPSTAVAFAKSARKKAVDNFNEEIVFSRLQVEYQRLLGKNELLHMQSIFSSLVRGRKPNFSYPSSLENKNRHKKYLITGGAGFIGSHLANSLAEKGNSVVVIDDLLNGSITNFNPAVKFFKINISDSKLFDIFKAEKPDIVYHLAGPIHLRKEFGETFKKDETFLIDFKNILEYARRVNVKKVIFLSSGGAIYSGSTMIPTPETYQVNPKSLYALANIMIEQTLQEYDKKYGLEGIIFIVFLQS